MSCKYIPPVRILQMMGVGSRFLATYRGAKTGVKDKLY
jgi:hypothetical protein